MRSSDIILGLTYDVPAFTIFQELLAFQLTQELGRPIGLGSYTHLSASLHLYERHFKMAEKILEEDKKQDYRNVLEMPPMPSIPPLEDLMATEREIRKCMTVSALTRMTNNINLKNDYWNDWCKVLASHKALKLGDATISNQILCSTSFKGYAYFVKE